MKKVHVILMTALAVVLIGPMSQAAAEQKLNVLFIAIDDLNDWVGCFDGNPQVKTPNLDKFASEGGMVMMNAYAPATVCCPSRSALLTGVHAHKTGVYGNKNNLKNAPKAKDVVTLPEYFSQHGYHSLSMGKIFHRHPLPGDNGSNNSDTGQWAFDEYHKTRRYRPREQKTARKWSSQSAERKTFLPLPRIRLGTDGPERRNQDA